VTAAPAAAPPIQNVDVALADIPTVLLARTVVVAAAVELDEIFATELAEAFATDLVKIFATDLAEAFAADLAEIFTAITVWAKKLG